MKYSLGIELGSTRIKSVIIEDSGKIVATGVYDWENKLENGFWTYDILEVKNGLRACIKDLKKNLDGNVVVDKMGISAMMHGYIVLDKNDNLLVPFRTWRNTNAVDAANVLTELFNFNIPIRWSVSHLYQAILNSEPHIKDIAYITTLSGYVHYMLTGEKVIGSDDASGMFPLNSNGDDYNQDFLNKFDSLIKDKGYIWNIKDIFPKVKKAGEIAGKLTLKGKRYLDCNWLDNVVFCPPEGDAGTGMVATNSVRRLGGNVSVGTSAFAMIVLDKALKKLHTEIDIVNTPDGNPVAMIHCNNCTSDLNAWVNLFEGILKQFGCNVEKSDLYEKLFKLSLNGDSNFGKLINYSYVSSEPIANIENGMPMFIRDKNANFTLANFMKTQVYGAISSLAFGVDILKEENIKISEIKGHGGFFKTKEVGQRAMSAILDCPVSVYENAGEGGAWGMALLANFIGSNLSFPDYLDKIFAQEKTTTINATTQEKEDFKKFFENYKQNLKLERV